MHLQSLAANDFRNLKSLSVNFSKDLNVIYGDNAAGKSSFLEAVTYLLSGRSFRSHKQTTFSEYAASGFTLFGEFSNKDRLGVSYSNSEKSKSIRLNGKNIQSLANVVNIYPVQSLSPESYHLIDSGPNERRKYLDWLLFHVEHNYQAHWSSYNRLLKQRNSLLKAGSTSLKPEELNSWNSQFLTAAALVDKKRVEIALDLTDVLVKILVEMDFEYAKDIKLSYYSGYTGSLETKLEESFNRDCMSGTTQYGPHKADLKIKVKGNLAKDVLSRGQKKMLINSLFLAQTKLLKQRTSKDSLFVIDDFSSELDESNQLSLVKALSSHDNVQIIMSCLQPSMINPLIKEYNSVNMFHVEHGVITSQ